MTNSSFSTARYIRSIFLLLILGFPIAALPSGLEKPIASERTSIHSPAESPLVIADDLTDKDRIEVFERIWSEINEYFYDPTFNGINWKEVHDRYAPQVIATKNDDEFYALMGLMVGELHDSHTRVSSPAQLADRKKQQRTEIGVTVDQIEGKMVITEVRPDSNAAKAGIEPGMIVRTINDKPVEERIAAIDARLSKLSVSTERQKMPSIAASLFAGAVDSKVKVGLQRADGTNFDATLTRQSFPNSHLISNRLLPSGYGYIFFNSFDPQTAKEFKDALTKLGNVPGLILDIRANQGGSNEGLYPIVNSFYKEKILFLKDSTRTGKPLGNTFGKLPLEIYLGGANGYVYSGPVVILANEASGSTAEMFAGGMQESGRAKVVGTQTCGCVVGINKRRELKGGGLLDIGEVVWLTPKGRILEREGVIPDKTVVPTISDIQEKRDPVLDEAEGMLKKMTTKKP